MLNMTRSINYRHLLSKKGIIFATVLIMKEKLQREGRTGASLGMVRIQFLFQGRCISADAEGHSVLSLSGLSSRRILRDGLMKVKIPKAVLN